MLHQDVSDYDNEVTYLVIAWGQMLDHDLTFAALPKGNLCLKISPFAYLFFTLLTSPHVTFCCFLLTISQHKS